jgi:hypothetical protein
MTIIIGVPHLPPFLLFIYLFCKLRGAEQVGLQEHMRRSKRPKPRQLLYKVIIHLRWLLSLDRLISLGLPLSVDVEIK